MLDFSFQLLPIFGLLFISWKSLDQVSFGKWKLVIKILNLIF